MAKKSQTTNNKTEEVKEQVTAAPEVEKPKPRRGRPPKNAKQETENVKTEATASKAPTEATDAEKPKPRRGRPPKAKSEPVKESSTESASTPSEEVVVAPKRKRGRPPKASKQIEAAIEVKTLEHMSEVSPDTQYTYVDKDEFVVTESKDADEEAENITEEVTESEETQVQEETKEPKPVPPCIKYIILGIAMLILIFGGIVIAFALNEYIWTLALLLVISVGFAVLAVTTIKFIIKGKSERKANE